MAEMPSFVHLRLHTEYSLVDSVIRVDQLMKTVAASGMQAVAMTDQGNLFALVKFYRAAVKHGIKPVVGADLWLAPDTDAEQPSRFTLLCCSQEGYRNLSTLVSRSYLEGQQRGVPMVHRDWLPQCTDGLIALSGGREGDVGQALFAGREDQAELLLRNWNHLFPDRYYVELTRSGRENEEAFIRQVVPMAARNCVPVVATADVRFLKPLDFEAHEARVCIQQGRTLNDPRRPRSYSEAQYLRTAGEMAEVFHDLPEALENTVQIARRCNFRLRMDEIFLPNFPVPEGMNIEAFLTSEARTGLAQRLETDGVPTTAQHQYQSRLDLELGVIADMGFPGYFLIVADFIRWAKQNGIPVGPGRGSGAGSLVAYALGITDLDPIRHELLFERFLNPERVSLPDFDVDFCMEGRDRVIEYVAERYGRDHVSQIITYGSMAARAVVRDVGRVLGHPYGYVDRIAKLIPFEIGMTLDKAMQQDEELRSLYHDDEEVRTLIDLACSLEGLARNAGKHAGGVVIAPEPLTRFMPLYCEAGGGHPVTQLDKDDVEKLGLVKFDFLGLRTLTIIDRAVRTINSLRADARQPPLDMLALPREDALAFELLKKCQTTAVFQLESRGMKDLIRRLQPDCFDDIVALVALFRPGPLQSGMVDDFISRKHGHDEVDYPHPKLEPILKPTYGVILYQEQVMQIAQTLAGYTLGGADLLRRAMGKKKPEEMAKQRDVFLAGAKIQGVDGDVASYIFDLMEKFAGYGFNKSHSAAYAVLSYQTAWLKAHYPAAFMAAVLSSDMDHTDKVVTLIDECRNMSLEVLPPDINQSGYAFTVTRESEIRYGLGAIKGMGQSAINCLIEERRANGVFSSLSGLCKRIDLHKINRRALEALIKAGALDSIDTNRAGLMKELPKALMLADQHHRATAAGQDDLFGLAAPASTVSTPAISDVAIGSDTPGDADQWDEDERLTAEKETLGLYLTGHPFGRYETELAGVVSSRIAPLVEEQPAENERRGYGAPQRSVIVAGLIVDIRKRGGRMSLMLDDRTARLEVTLFEDAQQQFRHLIAKDTVVVVEGKLGFDEFINAYRLTVKEIRSIDEVREAYARALVIEWDGTGSGPAFVNALRDALAAHRPGNCAVYVQYHGQSAGARVPLGDEWRVKPTLALIKRLENLTGPGAVALHYARPSPTTEGLRAAS